MARNPLYWPYPPESIWNMPIGASASFQPLNGTAPSNHFAFRWEEDIIVFSPDSPEKTIKEHNAGWSGADRCASRTGRDLTGNGTVSDVSQPIPSGWNTTNYLGNTPNHSAAIVYRSGADLRAFETQPFHICADEVPISQFVNSDWVGDSILTGGDGVKGGSHGGSYMTAFGGTIRLGEWVPGGEIPHATKFVCNTNKWCADQTTQSACFRWPALRADSGAVSGYGSQAWPGLPSGAKMGMLVSLPASFNVEALQTEPARILGRSIRDYGSYLVDGDAGLDVFMWAVEWSHEGRVIDEFEDVWGIKGFHRPIDGPMPALQVDFLEDMRAIEEALVLVNDNSPSNIGGAGTRRAPLAPEFEESEYFLNGTLFQKAPAFPSGTVTRGVRTLNGTLFQKAPTFPSGTVSRGSRTLTGSLFQKAPTFSAGTLTVGAATLSGTLFQKAPFFEKGVLAQPDGSQVLSGVLFTKSPTFAQGLVARSQVLSGVPLTKSPTFPAGTITAGPTALSGTLFQKAPTFPAGIIVKGFTGVLFVESPTFFTGTISSLPLSPVLPLPPSGSVRVGVWSLPDDPDGFRLLCEPPFLNGTSFQDRIDVIGGGRLVVPADYEHLNLIVNVDPSDIESFHSSIIRGLQFWDGEWHVVWEFFADEAEEEITKEGQRVVSITGLDVRSAPDDGVVYPRKPTSPHWQWGAPTLLENHSFEATLTTSSQVQLSINATAGTFRIGIDYPTGTGYVYTAPIAFNAGASNIAIAIEGLMAGWDVFVTGTGTVSNPFVIEMLNPTGVQVGWVTDSGSLTGIASILYDNIGGQSVTEPWSRSFNPTNGIEHGYYTGFAVSTEQAHTGSYSLKVTGQLGPWAESYPGVQQIVSVAEGEHWASIWVYPMVAGLYRFVIRTLDETHIASTTASLTAASWQEITIPTIIMPSYAAQVIFRIARIEDSSTPVTWYVDDAIFAPGFPATTWGDILGILMGQAIGRGTLNWLELGFDAALDSDGVPWDNDEFAFQADALMKLGSHVIADGEAAGYEHDVVRLDPPVGALTHTLLAYNPLGRGDVSLQAAVVGAFNSARVAKRRVPYTHLLLELNDGTHVVVADDRLVGFGRRERGVRVEQATDRATAIQIGHAIFNKEIPNLLATQITLTGNAVIPYRDFDIGWIVPHTLGQRALKHNRRIQVITSAFSENRWVWVVTAGGVET